MPSLILGFKCPREYLLCSSLRSSFLSKVFGCIFFVYVLKSDKTKLDPKALKYIFRGHDLS